jgi:hypothetical protein
MSKRTSLMWLRRAASKGHADALLGLGVAYLNGEGVRRNRRLAKIYFKNAVAAGSLEAAFNLGLMHEQRIHGRHDFAEARAWYLWSARRGDVEAHLIWERRSDGTLSERRLIIVEHG